MITAFTRSCERVAAGFARRFPWLFSPALDAMQASPAEFQEAVNVWMNAVVSVAESIDKASTVTTSVTYEGTSGTGASTAAVGSQPSAPVATTNPRPMSSLAVDFMHALRVLRGFKAVCQSTHWSRWRKEWNHQLRSVPASCRGRVRVLVQPRIPPASVWRNRPERAVKTSFITRLRRDVETMRNRFRKQKRLDHRRSCQAQQDIFTASKSYTNIGDKVDAMLNATVFCQSVSGPRAERAKSWSLGECMRALRQYPEGSMLWAAEHSSGSEPKGCPIPELVTQSTLDRHDFDTRGRLNPESS